MTRSTFVIFLLFCMYFSRQIQWCDQTYLWSSSMESWRYSMDQEGFLKVHQIYFYKFLSYKEVWYINVYVLCKTIQIMWSKLLMDIIIGVKNILRGSGRGPEGWPDLLLSKIKLQRNVIYHFVYFFNTNPMVW